MIFQGLFFWRLLCQSYQATPHLSTTESIPAHQSSQLHCQDDNLLPYFGTFTCYLFILLSALFALLVVFLESLSACLSALVLLAGPVDLGAPNCSKSSC